jgi:hypothetical protein
MPIPRTEQEWEDLLEIWSLNAANHKARYNLTTDMLAQIGDDFILYQHSRLVRQMLSDESAGLTAYKQDLFKGTDDGTIGAFPAINVPAVPATVNPPKPGIEKRNAELYNFFKSHPNRTPDSLADLGITETVSQSISPDDALALITKTVAKADDTVEVHFKKMGFPQARIERKIGDGEFQKIAEPSTSPYVDDTPSTGGKPEKREYRAICMENNKPVGSWSQIATVVTTP